MPIDKDGIIRSGAPNPESPEHTRRHGLSFNRKGTKPPPAPKIVRCINSRKCGQAATCVPRLYVPRHPMSVNAAADDVSALMGAAFCEGCFKKLDPQQFLKDEVKERIALEFRKRNAIPNFAKAVLGRIPAYDPDYGRYEAMRERAERQRRV